ncbi:VanZ family protein [Streptomyces filipinensis]|uniref:VanZ family protein n=1 Tax=Streptomyces filipinensis TaxID=66887 RepID=UPI001E62A169|nr:VanZ family protein [Streptomyces filipinensis]
MFDAVFGDDIGFLAGLTAVAVVAGALAWALARRRRAAHPGWWAPLACCLTGVLGVTLALRGGEAGRAECVINHEITEPLYTTQGLWNLAMFVPLGLFGVLALRRPLPVLAGVLALPFVIELTQALAPFASGVCDSADVEMNAGGGVVGVAAGLVWSRGRVAWRAWAAPTVAVTAVLAVLGAVVCGSAVTLDHVDGSTVRDAHGDERVAAERAVRQAFGDRYRVGAVRVRPGLDGYSGSMSVQFAGGFPAELMWPGGRRLTVDFESTGHPKEAAFAVPGAATPRSTADAYRIARTYMRAHYPWADSAPWHATRAVDDPAGWVTSWRYKERGVEMPRSLDVRLDRAGHVTGLQVDLGPTHVPLPAHLLSARQAERLVREQEEKGQTDTTGLRIHAGPLTTERTKGDTGPWRAIWSVVVADTPCASAADGIDCEPSTWRLDARTGEEVG